MGIEDSRAVLVASGFLMSFQFTAYNTIAFDEIAPDQMSGACWSSCLCPETALARWPGGS
jgi:hypothetical protein